MKYKPSYQDFSFRHIGPRNDDIKEMLSAIGISSIEEMINETVPDSILLTQEPALDSPLTETELIEEMNRLAEKNKV